MNAVTKESVHVNNLDKTDMNVATGERKMNIYSEGYFLSGLNEYTSHADEVSCVSNTELGE